MTQFMGSISETLQAVVSFFTDLINYIIEFFKMITSSVVFMYEIVEALPVPVKAGALCIISVSVIYLIVGRE